MEVKESQMQKGLQVRSRKFSLQTKKQLKVILRGEECLVKRNLPGQRVGAKAWFDFFTEYLTEELNYASVHVWEEVRRVSF